MAAISLNTSDASPEQEAAQLSRAPSSSVSAAALTTAKSGDH